MRLLWTLLLTLWLIGGATLAQEEAQNAQDDAPVVTDIRTTTRTDAFGLTETLVRGVLVNDGERAYRDIDILVDVLDAQGELVGEGFGFVVDACDTALIDFALQPGERVAFKAPFELYEPDGSYDELVVRAEGTVTQPTASPQRLLRSVTTVRENAEVVALEWLDGRNLRYATGCYGDIFSEHTWFQYNLDLNAEQAIAHPLASNITDTFIRQANINRITQSGERNPNLVDNSLLTPAPDGRRLIFQNDIHTVITVEPNGTFARLVLSGLHRQSLQGFHWLDDGRFLAYYYGATGDPVRYFTGSVDGQLVSRPLDQNRPSVTRPGATAGGSYAIIGTTLEGVTGYYLHSLVGNENILLLQASLPGNNWPAPIYDRVDANTRYVYLVRPVNGVPMLQCFHRDANRLHTLTELPLQLGREARAWSWLAPDRQTLAIGANGRHGGLWLVDLNAFDVCAAGR